MIWFLLIGVIIYIVFNLIESLDGILEILLTGFAGIMSLATFIIHKITGFSILENIPKYGIVVIIIIISKQLVSYFWKH